jgi:predicted lipoprotein with Yx(FWY)xxD motif
MNRVRVILSMAGVATAGVLLLAACSGGAGSSTAAAPNTSDPQTQTSSVEPDSGSANSAASDPATEADVDTTALTATKSSTLGTVVTDSKGRTLYRFDNDTTNPSTSHCTGACAVKWPPVIGSGQVTLNGVDQSAASTVTRPDGSKQLTIGGWAVYEFSGDGGPGDVKGQGIGGTWFAITPQGKKAGTTGQQAPTTTGGSAGYGY